MTTDLGFLSEITTQPPLNYIFYSLIGLYSSISFVCIEEKRLPNRYDFMKLVGYIPFVWGFALLIGTSPLYSLFIGIVPEPAFKFVKRAAERWLEEKLEKDTENKHENENENEHEESSTGKTK